MCAYVGGPVSFSHGRVGEDGSMERKNGTGQTKERQEAQKTMSSLRSQALYRRGEGYCPHRRKPRMCPLERERGGCVGGGHTPLCAQGSTCGVCIGPPLRSTGPYPPKRITLSQTEGFSHDCSWVGPRAKCLLIQVRCLFTCFVIQLLSCSQSSSASSRT